MRHCPSREPDPGIDFNELITDEGRWTDKGSAFTVKLKDNGTMPTKFRDTEFEIPAALTKGKPTLNLKLVTRNSLAVNTADAKLTNKYFYSIYCYAGTASSQ